MSVGPYQFRISPNVDKVRIEAEQSFYVMTTAAIYVDFASPPLPHVRYQPGTVLRFAHSSICVSLTGSSFSTGSMSMLNGSSSASL